MSDEKRFELTPPVAILAAGVIIAGAILYTQGGGASAGPGPQTPPSKLSSALYTKLAAEFGANEQEFAACMGEKRYQQKIDADIAEAEKNGANGTPFTLLYDTQSGKALPVSGALPYEQFKAALAALPEEAVAINIRAPSEGDHLVGSPTAPVVLIEYSDFECPYCRLVHPTLKRLVAESGGEVAWAYRHLPLTSIHPEANPAALASECIAEQLGSEGFFKFADAVFK